MDRELEFKLRLELTFMYDKYEQLCVAYKKLAESQGKVDPNAISDMSNMTFQQETKEK